MEAKMLVLGTGKVVRWVKLVFELWASPIGVLIESLLLGF